VAPVKISYDVRGLAEPHATAPGTATVEGEGSERRAVVVFNVMSDKTAFPFYDADKIQSIDEG